MRVTSIANFKGGTGKTATAVNLAAYLAEAGYRVLLIDADPQHNATDFYGPLRDGASSLYDVLTGETAGAPWCNVVEPTDRENVFLLGADMRLLTLDLSAIINGVNAALPRMADLIEALRWDTAVDFVLIDCPPSFTAASVAALTEADDVILPTRADAWSRAGVLDMAEQVRSLGRRTGARPVCRVLVTMADRTNLSRQAAEELSELGLAAFRTRIRATVAVGESSYARRPLIDYAPTCSAARDYDALAQEYLQLAEEGERPDEDVRPYAEGGRGDG